MASQDRLPGSWRSENREVLALHLWGAEKGPNVVPTASAPLASDAVSGLLRVDRQFHVNLFQFPG